jgi:hypothetical protein
MKRVTDKEIQQVFDHWNLYKGRGNWVSHREMSKPTAITIRRLIKQVGLKNLITAIDNFALVFLSTDYIWTHRWTLREFLTRTRPDNRSELQLCRFLPGDFDEEGWLQPYLQRRRREERKKRLPPPLIQKILPVLKSVPKGMSSRQFGVRTNKQVKELGE